MTINCWAHTADEPAKMFPSCVWWNPRAKTTKNRRQNIRKLGKTVFGSFLSSAVFCSVYYPAEGIIHAGTRGNDDTQRTVKKYHCLIVLLLISLPFINHYRIRLTARYKLISYSAGALGSSEDWGLLTRWMLRIQWEN